MNVNQDFKKNGLKSRIFITVGEQSVACGTTANSKNLPVRQNFKERMFCLAGRFQSCFFRRSLTCGYEDLALRATSYNISNS
jgi:hypothetical protein